MWDLQEASGLLLRAIRRLEEVQRSDSVQVAPGPTVRLLQPQDAAHCWALLCLQAVQQSMVDRRTLMRDVLEDSRLVGLQREGGAVLARLRKESDLRYPDCEDLR